MKQNSHSDVPHIDVTGWLGRTVLLAGLLMLALAGTGLAATGPAGVDATNAAKHVDELLAKELYGGDSASGNAALPLVDDESFIRRACLDLIGEQPSPEQITAFVLDPSPQKRRAAVERMLADKHYGQNWGRYWRDVILYRRSDDRALLAAKPLVVYLTEQLNKNTHWDVIAREFITATGEVFEQGETALIMAHLANPEEVTAEVSRIFLGIQIQCAQCHDHRTDRWKREQFHQMTAFFPRIAVRRMNKDEPRSFRVVGDDKGFGKRAPGNSDNVTTEHYMPDLNDPQAKGTLMQPVFFATGQKLELGTTDHQRRESLARWLTAPQDVYFSQAFVNRLWAELVGRGFAEPVDDMGPDHKPRAPETLKFLAEQFTASGYDIKWLMRTIMATSAYQRQSRSRSEPTEEPFASSCPQRLRADQLYNSLVNALGIDEAEFAAPRGERKGGAGTDAAEKKAANGQKKPNNAQKNYQGLGQGPRGQALQAFGYDPSEHREEIAGSIPQALWLMNGPVVNRSIDGAARTHLAELLAKEKDDEAVSVELYLRCLAREPKPSELKTCLAYVRSTGERAEAFEDILWSLVNSTEFLYRK